MFSRRFPVAVCTFLLIVSSGLTKDKAAFRYPEGKVSDYGELKYRNGLPVLVVSGTPEQMGKAIGKLALKPAKQILDYPKDALDIFNVGFLWNSLLRTGKRMYGRFPDRFKTEIDAMIESADVSKDNVIAGNTLFDIKKIVNCSSLMVEGNRSETGGPLLGRNLDYPSTDYLPKYSLVTVYRPKGKHAWASIGFPGLAGCLSGMNDAGLTVAVLEAFVTRPGEGRFNSKGLPYALCYRILLEECTTIEEAHKKLKSLPRTTIMNLIVGDKKHVGVFEISPKSVIYRKSVGGMASCTNHFNSELKGENQPNIGNTFGRYRFLEESRTFKTPITIDHIHNKLHRVSFGSQTLQTMVFEPKTLKLHLAIGKAPASQHPLRELDLKPLFEGTVKVKQTKRSLIKKKR